MSKLIYAYSDESGNTGNNVFDAAQPYFWLGTLLTENEQFKTWNNFISICRCKEPSIGDELHGNDIGLPGIDKIAKDIEAFLEENNCHFIISRIEKLQIARMKFVDTILDSGLNKAVSHLHYNIRLLRYNLAYILSENLSPESLRGFWDASAKRDLTLFRQIIGKVRWNIANKIPDRRAQELLIDACDWAMKYPEVLLDRKRDEMDSPNMVAFILLIQKLHERYEGTDTKIGKFYHDEQNQFAKSMKKSYEILKQTKFSIGGAVSVALADPAILDTYNCQLEISSSSSPGIQLIDTILWLTRRTLEKGNDDFSNCLSLFRNIYLRTDFVDWSKEAFLEEFQQMLQELYAKPLSAEDLARGESFLRDIEARRKKGLRTIDIGQ